ncbi:hypothetical protein DFH06DRAFT_1334179 [Mycena polygramma]|nr:hypothetical protein DFH06DRAFT_1334179 [Mycena polygramma]
MRRVSQRPVLVCIERRRRAAAPTPSTPCNDFPRAHPNSCPLFLDCFGRRQAIAASKRNASGPLPICVARSAFKLTEPDTRLPCVQRVAKAPRSGANCFDTTYRTPTSGVSILEIWPPAGTRRLQAQWAEYSTCVCPVRREGAAQRRQMLRHDVSTSRGRAFGPAGKHLLLSYHHHPPPIFMTFVNAALILNAALAFDLDLAFDLTFAFAFAFDSDLRP